MRGTQRRWWGGPAAVILAGVLAGCGPSAATVDGDGGGNGPDGGQGGLTDAGIVSCESATYFENTAWPQVFSKCAACHVPGGASGGTRFVLKPVSAPNAVALDFSIVADVARTLTDHGTSLLLLKPTGKMPHTGGVVIADGTPEAAVLQEMVRQFFDPNLVAACSGDVRSPLDGVTLADPVETLRKAALQLVGRPLTDAEVASAAASDPNTLAGLDPLLLAMMNEDNFYDRLKEMWNDQLLTDKNRVENNFSYLSGYGVSAANRAGAPYCDPVNWQNYDERNPTMKTQVCLGASEALAREPLEMVAHVVKQNRPFSEILTGQYRYLNVFAATLFGIDLTPFAGHESDAKFFAEVRVPAMHGPGGVPEEYAGLVTTTSFLYRYNSTSSNRNRGRAHRFYKFFLDKDVMQSATRLDLSTIDLTKSPWRYDAQCTGCHASIDPVAGAFQHWTNCYDIQQVEYYGVRYCGRTGWYDETDMFAPGYGPGDADKLSPMQLPTAMAALAQATVMDTAFARSVAALVLSNLTGHPRLRQPADPAAPDYAALDAAWSAQAKTIDQLAQAFIAAKMDFKQLIIAAIKTPAFRAINADRANRLELTGMGGGTLTTPENLHRKIASIMGSPWTVAGGASNPAPSLRDPPSWLISLEKFRIFAGGIDSDGVQRRQSVPGTMSDAVATRMALEMACQYTAYDFALDVANRHLFPKVERSVVPNGNAADPSQAPILANLKWLHQRFWGESPADGDPELMESYQLLSQLQAQGVAAVGAGKEAGTLNAACAANRNFATGQALPQGRAFSDDAKYTVRAWQGVIAYLLLDYRFIVER